MKLRQLLLLLVALAGTANGAPPLFESDETLVLTIEAPMRDLIKKRKDKPELDAVVSYVDASGKTHVISATISSRGNHRLETCDFPPLRLEFGKGAGVGTVFEDQRKLKMVTRCGRGSDMEAWLYQEYGIYRAYNVITDLSYRVRKLEVIYRDTESKRWKREFPAFFIESTRAVAARHNRVSIRPPYIEDNQYDLRETTNKLLFQYLIANTDFAVKKGPSGEGCCHNGRVIGERGSQSGWVVLPYDFDQAGIVNTDYALPDKRLRIRTVSTRLYRGFCWQNESLPDTIGLFNAQREEITAALVRPEVSSTRQRRTNRFVDQFYDIVNDPGELQERIKDKCRGAASFEIRKTTSAGE